MNTQFVAIAILAAAFAGSAIATDKTPTDLKQEAQRRAPSASTGAEVRVETVPNIDAGRDCQADTSSASARAAAVRNVSCETDMNAHFLDRLRCSLRR